MSLEMLWTDYLIWLLVLMIALFSIYSLQRPHLRAPWQKVANSNMAMSSVMVLLLFVLIALADSIHFRTNDSSGQIISVLDLALTDLKNNEEKTYSAPFALYQYNIEPIEQADGSIIRSAPRLKYGGRHLANVSERSADIWQKLALALVISIVIFLVLWWLTKITRVLLLTGFVLTFIVLSIGFLSPWYHVAGTDKVGQDVLYQAIKGIRTGLVIGTLTTLIMLPFAIMLGLMAGFLRGWVDDVIQYLYTTINSIPGVLLIAASILMVQVYIANHPEAFNTALKQADMRMLSLCVILGITSWTGLCRIIRAETLKLKEMEYVLAARSLGVSSYKIMLRHLLPNVSHVILISIILDFSALVLAEAVLSYVGVGVDPTTFSWGNMINTSRLEMAREPVVWWSLLAAFSFMFSLVLAANLFADVTREAFNPKSSTT